MSAHKQEVTPIQFIDFLTNGPNTTDRHLESASDHFLQ